MRGEKSHGSQHNTYASSTTLNEKTADGGDFSGASSSCWWDELGTCLARTALFR